MRAADAVALCRLARTACPATKLEQLTPLTWVPAFADVRFRDAVQALRVVADRQPYVDQSEILAEVRRIRDERIEAYGELPAPPPEVADGPPAAYITWQRDLVRRIGDGDLTRSDELERTSAGRPRRVAELVTRVAAGLALP